MSWISVDVEADGQYPGFGIQSSRLAGTSRGYSMIAIGACLVEDPSVGFLGYLRPISDQWDPQALEVSGFTREETLEFPQPITTMAAFAAWIKQNAEPPFIFVADNNGFDFAFTNWYFWQFYGRNPFGFSSKNINNLYQGLVGDTFASFKHLRKTPHDHNPMHDAMGNAEALLAMKEGIEVNGEVRKLKAKF